MSLSEEEQAAIIARKTTTSSSAKEVDRATTDKENVFTERGKSVFKLTLSGSSRLLPEKNFKSTQGQKLRS